ncbi:hypothetical protein SADUNF_Sadunf05G0108600 [Salix dunnii]|uniref:Uncharacterized protein n=1 Tax=Salix dunnii TaxID=1413687 RepID=A0A835K7U0_9ROSI|nr:hypothetical protein SADUNF_Sadunf05G0108600 [Salix dunnii]
MKTYPCQSPGKVLGFGTILVMTTKTASLGDQIANLTKLVEGLSTYKNICGITNGIFTTNELKEPSRKPLWTELKN